jgi:AraC-like DNA-binding protein
MELERSEIGDENEKLVKEETAGSEPDLPPEYCHYRDDGCEFAGSCLNCPFPQCLYDKPRGRQRWLKELRNKEIARVFSSGGWGVKELALMFGISQRTVQRALKSTLSISFPAQGGEPDQRKEIT